MVFFIISFLCLFSVNNLFFSLKALLRMLTSLASASSVNYLRLRLLHYKINRSVHAYNTCVCVCFISVNQAYLIWAFLTLESMGGYKISGTTSQWNLAWTCRLLLWTKKCKNNFDVTSQVTLLKTKDVWI